MGSHVPWRRVSLAKRLRWDRHPPGPLKIMGSQLNLAEHPPCKREVVISNITGSTKIWDFRPRQLSHWTFNPENRGQHPEVLLNIMPISTTFAKSPPFHGGESGAAPDMGTKHLWGQRLLFATFAQRVPHNSLVQFQTPPLKILGV